MILTYTGKTINPYNVRPDDICIEDIAHGLSLLCRYSGQCNKFYSVAEHSIIMAVCSWLPGNPLAKLLHDAAEAYIGDIIRPIKRKLSKFRQFENNFMYAIAYKFGLAPSIFATVKKADNIMLATEAFWMMPSKIFTVNKIYGISKSMVDTSIPFYYFNPSEAEKRFLKFYSELRNR